MAPIPPTIVQIDTNLDDSTGEIVASAIDSLLAAGALDAWATPIIMKKGRPGLTLSVLTEESKRDALARMIIELTGTLGVRFRGTDRLTLDRRIEPIDTPFGKIPIKVGSLDGKILSLKPEFEDARRAAQQHNVPVRIVLDAAHAAALARFKT